MVWQSERAGSSLDIRGRRYDAAGSAIGVEFQVNTFTTNNQYRARVGRASDGRFVVSWTSFMGDGSSYGIAARRFDAFGNPTGSEFVVNSYTTGVQIFPNLAVEADGDFVVVWQEGNRDGSGSAIFGQRFNASGIRLGSDFQVNTYTTGDQRVPAVNASPAGGFVVAWTSRFFGTYGTAAIARRFDAGGNAVGSDFIVSPSTFANQYRAEVAHDAGGNFVVAWHGPGDGSSHGTFAQRFSASGARRGAEFRVNSYTTAAQSFPSLAFDFVGNFVVVWQSDGQDGSAYGVFAQRFLSDLIFEDGFDPTTP